MHAYNYNLVPSLSVCSLREEEIGREQATDALRVRERENSSVLLSRDL